MSNLTQFAQRLRTQARGKGSFFKPIKAHWGAWSVLLSYGTREEMKKLTESYIQSMRERGDAPRPNDLEFLQNPKARWHLSLKLQTRTSTEEDWRTFGAIAAAMGAPQDALLTPLETTPPNAVHHWSWYE